MQKIFAARKKKILKKYHTIDKMKAATVEELSRLMPENIARDFHEFLNKNE